MGEERIRANETLIQQLLACPSGGDENGNEEALQFLKQWIEENWQLLDSDFVRSLHRWAEDTLPNLEARERQLKILTMGRFGQLIQQFPLGDRADNLELSIAVCELILAILTDKDSPQIRASVHNNLGNALERAIAFYQQALSVRTPAAFPVDWAATQDNLGNAYCDRIRGDRAENLEKALAFYEQALTVYTPTTFPVDWATTQNNLGTAYFNRIRGDRAENLGKALAAYEQALTIRTPTTLPADWADTQNNLSSM